MKYIRTKDGHIYDYERICNILKDENGVVRSSIEKIGMKWKEEQMPITYADTIEELCDVFVGVDKNGEHYTNSESVNDLIHMTQDILHVTLTTIYGEIWVNDELHKVAKMNDKGEFELL